MTEICPHGDLFTLLHNPEAPFSWKLRLKVAQDIALGLQYLQGTHGAGVGNPYLERNPPVAHIDLKSPNGMSQ